MNIGIVTAWFERGAGYVSRQYLEALQSSHKVCIYCRSGEGQANGSLEWDGDFVTWASPPMLEEPSAVDVEHFDKWLTEQDIQCVLFNEQRSWAPVIRCNQRGILNGAYVVHYREDLAAGRQDGTHVPRNVRPVDGRHARRAPGPPRMEGGLAAVG